MLKVVLSVLIFAIVIYYLQTSACGLTNEEIFSQFQFSFITPGARATALGGAFAGLADDATAAEANPAGLTSLRVPEVSLEVKHIAYSSERMYEHLPIPENYNCETGLWEGEITKRDYNDSVESIPFISVVYPYKRFVFTLYRQQIVNYKSTYQTGNIPIALPDTHAQFFPIDAFAELTVTNYGIGAAIQLFEELSLAISPRWSEMRMNSHLTRFWPHIGELPVELPDEDVEIGSKIDDGDSGFCFNAGILWKLHPKISIGAVYKSGAKFVVTETRFGPSSGDYNPDWAEFTLKVPDSFGAGIAFRVTDFLTFTVDAIHIQYKDLLEDFDEPPKYSVLVGGFVFGNIDCLKDKSAKDEYNIENATEVHVGMEYVLPLGERYLALRAGVYTDPDHTIRYTGSSEVEQNLFPGGSDQIHLTGGLGIAMSERFQIDAGANIAENSTQFSFSTVYRF